MGITGLMRRSWLLLAIALSGVVLIGVTVNAGRSAAQFRASVQLSGTTVAGTLALSTDRFAPGALVNVSELVPGDTAARQVTLLNEGDLPFTYRIAAEGSANTALWSDPKNGLQVSVHRGPALLYSGPLQGLADVSGGITLRSGERDTLVFVFTFPKTAGNSFQSLKQDLVLTYTPVQFASPSR